MLEFPAMVLRLAAAAMSLVMAIAGLTLVVLAGRPGHLPRTAGSAEAGVELAPLAEVTGLLRSISLPSGQVTVTGQTGSVRLAVARSTSVFCHGRLGSLDDLAVGQSVRAAYETGAPRPVAVWIELLP